MLAYRIFFLLLLRVVKSGLLRRSTIGELVLFVGLRKFFLLVSVKK